MKGTVWMLGLALSFLAAGCKSRSEEEPYQAPRNLGESVESWSDGQSTADQSEPCPYEDKKMCAIGYLGGDWWTLEGFGSLFTHLWQFAALVDIDYVPDPNPEMSFKYLVHTKLEVRKVIEVYLNRAPGGKWDEMEVYGVCDEKGHCRMIESWGPMPLWSGTNLVFGGFNYTCPPIGPIAAVVYEAYAVEGGRIYDYYGFDYDWNERREILMKAGKEAFAACGSVCEGCRGLEEPRPSVEDASSNHDIAGGDPLMADAYVAIPDP